MKMFAYQGHLLFTNAISGMLAVAAGWHAYEVTHDPMSIAFIGLLFFGTALTCFLPSGMASDKFNKRSVIIFAQTAVIVGCALVANWRAHDVENLSGLYFGLLFVAMGRSFEAPASASMLPEIVSFAKFPRNVAISTSVRQISKVVAPVLAGVLLAVPDRPYLVYVVSIVFAMLSMLLLLLFVKPHPRPVIVTPSTKKSAKQRRRDLLLGIRYVFRNRLLLGALLLDLLAGLFGNLSALLPIYVSDVLHQQADTLGFLRSSIAAGTFFTSILLGLKSLPHSIGKYMVGSVFILGAVNASLVGADSLFYATTILFCFGSIDSISVYIRQTLVQLATPTYMRGRVTAVNQLFVVVSNQLGEFRSGTMAALIGLKATIVVGGVMTVGLSLFWPRWFPSIWNLGNFAEAIPKEKVSAPILVTDTATAIQLQRS